MRHINLTYYRCTRKSHARLKVPSTRPLKTYVSSPYEIMCTWVRVEAGARSLVHARVLAHKQQCRITRQRRLEIKSWKKFLSWCPSSQDIKLESCVLPTVLFHAVTVVLVIRTSLWSLYKCELMPRLIRNLEFLSCVVFAPFTLIFEVIEKFVCNLAYWILTTIETQMKGMKLLACKFQFFGVRANDDRNVRFASMKSTKKQQKYLACRRNYYSIYILMK